jgi:hypothetical protein
MRARDCDRKTTKVVGEAIAIIEEARRLKTWWDNLTHEQRDDHFYIEMANIYWANTPVVEHILRVCAAFGVRFASVGLHDLVTFENVRYGGWPVSWHITKILGISFGCGNSGQHQVDLRRFLTVNPGDEMFGTFDLRSYPFVKRAPPLCYATMSFNFENKFNDEDDLFAYLQNARERQYA